MTLLLAIAACADPLPLDRPNRVAVAPDGTVYVSDFHNDRIVRFGPDGSRLGAFGRQGIGRGELWRVTAITVAEDGGLIVANRRPETDAAASAIRFELKRFVDGREVSRTLLDGRSLAPDGWIDAILVAPSGAVVVADSSQGDLVEIDGEGRRVGRVGRVPTPDAAPSALHRDGDDIWVVEQYRHRIRRVSPGGVEVPLTLQDDGSGLPQFPSAIAVCGDTLLVADLGNHRLVRLGRDGSFRGAIVPPPVGPDQPVQLLDVASNKECTRFYAVDSKGNRVLVLDEAGNLLEPLL